MTQTYRYEAARGDGTVLAGRIEAATSAQAGALLLERGLHPVRLDPTEPVAVAVRPAARRELAVAFRSLAALVAAGVPLERAVAATEALAPGTLRETLTEARARLHDGQTLAQALETAAGTVPPLVLGMLRAGERAGRLDGTLDQIAMHLEREAELIGRIRQALAYPALLGIAGLGSAVVIGAVVVPKFATLLGDMGQQLPPATRLLLAGSTLLTRHWLALLVSISGAAGLAATWVRRPEGRRRLDEVLLAMPAVGPLRHGLAMVRVCRALGSWGRGPTPRPSGSTVLEPPRRSSIRLGL